MKKLLLTVLTALLMCSNFAFSNIAEAAFFTCMVCNQSFDYKVGMGQQLGLCSDGYQHFLHPNGGISFTTIPRTEFEWRIRAIQGDWHNENGGRITIQGNYLNGCPIRSMVDVKGSDEVYVCKLIIKEQETRAVPFKVALGGKRSCIMFGGAIYYEK